jgi:hypothetical protein
MTAIGGRHNLKLKAAALIAAAFLYVGHSGEGLQGESTGFAAKGSGACGLNRRKSAPVRENP